MRLVKVELQHVEPLQGFDIRMRSLQGIYPQMRPLQGIHLQVGPLQGFHLRMGPLQGCHRKMRPLQGVYRHKCAELEGIPMMVGSDQNHILARELARIILWMIWSSPQGNHSVWKMCLLSSFSCLERA